MITKTELKQILEDYEVRELKTIAKELDLSCNSKNPTEIVKLVIEDLDTNGVPEEYSELLGDFLYSLGYELEEEDEEAPIADESKIKIPTCFGFHDPAEPVCKDCPIAEKCKGQRLKLRPICFGLLFDRTNEECKSCLEFGACGFACRKQ